MVKGFYHSEIGYWQTVGGNPKVEDYMTSTIEVPLKPSADHEWQGESWVHIPPPAPTPEELRAQMPDKTPREFRDALTRMGIMPPEVTVKIMEIPFEIERHYALNSWEVMTTATRTDPYIDMIGAMFGKTAEDIDVVWLT